VTEIAPFQYQFLFETKLSEKFKFGVPYHSVVNIIRRFCSETEMAETSLIIGGRYSAFCFSLFFEFLDCGLLCSMPNKHSNAPRFFRFECLLGKKTLAWSHHVNSKNTEKQYSAP